MEKSLSSLLHCHCHCCCVITVIIVVLLLSSLSLLLSSCCHHCCCCCHVVVIVMLLLLLHCCCCHVVVIVALLLLSHCCCCCCCCCHVHLALLVHTGMLDQGRVRAGHLVSPGMPQLLLVSTGDEEQVECTYLLENTDGQTDRQVRTWNASLLSLLYS